MGRIVISRSGRAGEGNHAEGPWPGCPGATGQAIGYAFFRRPPRHCIPEEFCALCLIDNGLYQPVIQKKSSFPIIYFPSYFWLGALATQYDNTI